MGVRNYFTQSLRALISFLILLTGTGIVPAASWAYQTAIRLQPCSEVVVRLLQSEGGKDVSSPHWGLCSTGDPDNPAKLYLCKYGPRALPLFNLATQYPLRTYLDQTPFEYNLRFLVSHDLEARARLEEDRKRLKESRKKFKALLKELGIEKGFQINSFYQNMFSGLKRLQALEIAANRPGQSVAPDDQLTKLEMSAVSTVLGRNITVGTGNIQGVDVVHGGAGGITSSNSILSGRYGPTRNLAAGKVQGPLINRERSDWIDKVFSGIMSAIHWVIHNIDVIGIVLGIFLLFGLFARK